MPEAYGRPDIQRQQLKAALERGVNFFERLPKSAFKNIIIDPLMGAATLPKLAYDISPFGRVSNAAESIAGGKLPAVPEYEILKEVLSNFYQTYKDPLKTLEEDPIRVLVDLASIAAPTKLLATKGGGATSNLFRRLMINKLGKTPSNIPSEMYTEGGAYTGASNLDILKESIKRKLPLNWIQGIENSANEGLLKGWFNPDVATVFDPELSLKNRAQIKATREIAQEFLDPTSNLRIEETPALTAKKIQEKATGPGGQTESLWDYVKGTKEDIFSRARGTTVPFSWEEEIAYERSGGQTGTKMEKRTKDITAPIILEQSYPILNNMKDSLNRIKSSLIYNQAALGLEDFTVDKLNGMLNNPSYKTLRGKFNIADLETIDKTRKGLNTLINYVKKKVPDSSGIVENLTDLSKALKNDILTTFEDPKGHGFYNKPQQKTLAKEYHDYLIRSREELKGTKTPAYEYLGKPNWEGTNPQEIMRDPEKGIKLTMGSHSNFEKGMQYLGKDTSRQVLLADMFEKTLDKITKGYNTELITEYMAKHRDKLNLVMNSDQKHALSVWNGIVRNQNKLDELQKAQMAYNHSGNKGIVNIVSGFAAGRPGLIALGGVNTSRLIFSKHVLAKIAADTDAVYAALKLSQTPINYISVLTRTKDFIRKVGKLNIIGQLQKDDGTTEDVRITSDGSIVNANEVAKPEWW
jgi:hypothetical protein